MRKLAVLTNLAFEKHVQQQQHPVSFVQQQKSISATKISRLDLNLHFDHDKT